MEEEVWVAALFCMRCLPCEDGGIVSYDTCGCCRVEDDPFASANWNRFDGCSSQPPFGGTPCLVLSP